MVEVEVQLQVQQVVQQVQQVEDDAHPQDAPPLLGDQPDQTVPPDQDMVLSTARKETMNAKRETLKERTVTMVREE